MKNEKRIVKNSNLWPLGLTLRFWTFSFSVLISLSQMCFAVTSEVVRHKSGSDLLEGQTFNTVVGSKGTIQLGVSAKAIVDKFDNAWSVNCVVVNDGAIYAGTSPNGGIYKYAMGKLARIYPETDKSDAAVKTPSKADANEPNDANTVLAEKHLSNEHIFAMATDVSGRLLAGVSGEKCRLIRFESGKAKVIFEPNDTKYIFAIVCDRKGNIYIGTGPRGKIFGLDSLGRNPHLVYQTLEKNILSLAAGKDGMLYAGTDTKGLVYKINPAAKSASVLYDSDQQELTSLLFGDDGNLYAAATAAGIVSSQAKFAVEITLAGRPESQPSKGKDSDAAKGGLKLQIANTKKEPEEKKPTEQLPSVKFTKIEPGELHIQNNPGGFCNECFQ